MASTQEKMICEMLNNVRGCNLNDSSERWETLISDYFTHDEERDNLDPELDFDDDEEELEDDNVIPSGNSDGDTALQQQQQVPLVTYEDEDNSSVSLHAGEAVVAEQCKDLISEHVEIEMEKVQNFKCVCKNLQCHQAFTPEEMLTSRLEFRAFNEGEFKTEMLNLESCSWLNILFMFFFLFFFFFFITCTHDMCG